MSEPVDADVSQRVTVIAAEGDAAADQVRDFLTSLGIEPVEWQQVSAWSGHSAPSALDVLDVALRRTAGVVAIVGWGHLDAEPAALAGLAVGATRGLSRVLVLGPADVLGREYGGGSPASLITGSTWGSSGFRISNDVEVRRGLIERLRGIGCAIETGSDSDESWRNAGDFSAPGVSPQAPPNALDLGLAHVDFDVSYAKRSSLLKRNAVTVKHHSSEPLLDFSIVGLGQEMRDVGFLGSPIASFPPNVSVPFNLEPDPGKIPTISLRIIARTQDGRMVIHDVEVAR